jgi:8-oxo-dGTP diphosphatase
MPPLGFLDGWKYCPRCAAELEEREPAARCARCGFVAYANSVPGAEAVCFDGRGRILLGRRRDEPSAGLWDLPGGFVEEGEHPLDAVRRELREEGGVEIEPLELAAIEMDVYGSDDGSPWTLNLYWEARIASGDPEPADDVSEFRWFAPEELPGDEEIAFANVARVLDSFRVSPDASER